MKHTFFLLGLVASLAFGEVLEPQFWSLERESWNGTTVAVEGAESKVGGYIRNPNVEYDYETLILPNLSGVNGTITSAKLQFRATGGNTGLNNSVVLHEQTNAFDANANVYYDLFGTSFWNNSLGSVAVATTPLAGTWYEIEGEALKVYLQSIVDGNTANNGMVLTGSFWHWGYALSLDDVKLELAVADEQELTQVQKILGFEDLNLWSARITADETFKVSGNQSGHYTHLAVNGDPLRVFSGEFSTAGIVSVGSKVAMKVRSPDREIQLNLRIGDNDDIGLVTINQSSEFVEVVYSLSTAQQAIFNANNMIRLSFNVPSIGVDYDFWVDEISFPEAQQVQ